MNIGDRIKEIRKDVGMTQQEFGNEINVSGNSIYRMENGSRNPSERTLSDICSRFNIQMDWLKTGNGEKEKPSEDSFFTVLKAKYSLDDLDIKMIKQYLELSPIEKQVFKDFIIKIKEEH